MSNLSRKLVVFPTSHLFAIIGTITLPEDPYHFSIPDIFNDKSSATHQARDHLHRPGKIYLSETVLFSLAADCPPVCRDLEGVHLAVDQVAAVVDFDPQRYRGNVEKRLEYRQRDVVKERLFFVLQDHAVSGMADAKDVYRRSESFLGLTGVQFGPAPAHRLSLPAFFEREGCPLPNYMAVNLGRVFHN